MADMSTAIFVFHGRLNFFLASSQKDQPILIPFRERQSVKHLAESLGVPHPEIGRVLVNDQTCSLDIITADGDHIEIHPIPDGCPVDPCFALDAHLGRLTAHLRMLGFDCLYQNDYEDHQLAEIAQGEGRILLTRDRRLLMRKVVLHGYCLRSLEPLEQVEEVLRRFQLTGRIHPFHRCLRCNHPLEPISKGAILDRLQPLTRKYFDEFQICPSCQHIYWRGSHYERMARLVKQLTEDQAGSQAS